MRTATLWMFGMAAAILMAASYVNLCKGHEDDAFKCAMAAIGTLLALVLIV